MTTPTTDELLSVMFEKLSSIDERQGATARAVTNLAGGLQAEATRRRNEDDRLSKVEAALATALVPAQADVTLLTAHDLANNFPPEVINKARSIQWARKKGEPEPLPDTPEPAVPLHHHRRKDDSITFKTDAHGDTRIQTNIKAKTLAGWGLAIVLGILHVYNLVHTALLGH